MKFIQRHPSTLELSDLSALPLRQRLLVARGATPSEETVLRHLLPPGPMKGLPEAVAAVTAAIDAGDPICIVGDYDADGATATAVLMRGLRAFGADVSFLVPNRFTDGYGLSPVLVERAAARGARLIVTVDNGIAAIEAVKTANRLGIPVVVTDHHLAADVLPEAVAIVNPNQPGCEFPSKALAGVGVALYLLVALRAAYKHRDDARKDVALGALFDIVALGTVADVVQLDQNNRILVSAGLMRMRTGQACPGIRSLFEVAGKDITAAGALDLGFYIGPRINAAGRMDDATVGIQCLVTDDEDEALALAHQLHATNLERRAVQEDIQLEAEAIVSTLPAAEHFSMVVADPAWHEGVIGVVAGRLKERFRRPTIVFTRGEAGLLKGSGRSIPSLHLRDALASVDAKLPGVITKFGGHAMAAGLSIREDALEAFKSAFEAEVRTKLTLADFDEIIEHDGALSAQDITVENAEWIQQGVWGQGFPAPSFLTPARVRDVRILKDKHTKLRLLVDDIPIDAILFNEVLEDLDGSVLVHGRLEVNEWKGQKSPQLLLSHVQVAN